jgi:hypothetical protein
MCLLSSSLFSISECTLLILLIIYHLHDEIKEVNDAGIVTGSGYWCKGYFNTALWYYNSRADNQDKH